jgi:hypothetical protein
MCASTGAVAKPMNKGNWGLYFDQSLVPDHGPILYGNTMQARNLLGIYILLRMLSVPHPIVIVLHEEMTS